jgi:hypothetical protein
MLPLPGPLTRQERCGDGLRGHHAGQLVRHDGTHEPRPLMIGAALDAGEARQRLDQRIVHRLLRERPLLAEAADRDVDDVRRQRPHLGFAEAHPLDHPAAEILDEHIRTRDQPLQSLHPVQGLQVQHDRALVAVVVEERSGEAAPLVGRGARVVAALRVLHLDDICTLVGQQHRRRRPRHHRGQIDDAIAVQRSRHGGLTFIDRRERVPPSRMAGQAHEKVLLHLRSEWQYR